MKKELPTEAEGHCPNCGKRMPMSSTACPQCKAIFGPGSAWQLKAAVRLDEKVVAIVKQFNLDAGAVASHAAGVVFETVQKTPLDELLASAQEKSLFPYAELTTLKLVPSRLFHSKVILQRRDGKRITFWGTRKNLLAAIEAVTRLRAQGVPVEVQ